MKDKNEIDLSSTFDVIWNNKYKLFFIFAVSFVISYIVIFKPFSDQPKNLKSSFVVKSLTDVELSLQQYDTLGDVLNYLTSKNLFLLYVSKLDDRSNLINVAENLINKYPEKFSETPRNFTERISISKDSKRVALELNQEIDYINIEISYHDAKIAKEYVTELINHVNLLMLDLIYLRLESRLKQMKVEHQFNLNQLELDHTSKQSMFKMFNDEQIIKIRQNIEIAKELGIVEPRNVGDLKNDSGDQIIINFEEPDLFILGSKYLSIYLKNMEDQRDNDLVFNLEIFQSYQNNILAEEADYKTNKRKVEKLLDLLENHKNSQNTNFISSDMESYNISHPSNLNEYLLLLMISSAITFLLFAYLFISHQLQKTRKHN